MVDKSRWYLVNAENNYGKSLSRVKGRKVEALIHVCRRFFCFVQVEGLQDFEWLKNVRYYWEVDEDTLVVRMSNSKYFY